MVCYNSHWHQEVSAILYNVDLAEAMELLHSFPLDSPIAPQILTITYILMKLISSLAKVSLVMAPFRRSYLRLNVVTPQGALVEALNLLVIFLQNVSGL